MVKEFKRGDLVNVIDGYGHTQSQAVIVKIDPIKNIIYVKEWLPNGRKLIYGVPLGALEPTEPKPTLTEVVEALRTCFDVSDKDGSK